ncbi:methyltransferase domain-containing protein [Marinovum sp. 2_MG-2023]|uniref:class I SAM-dependent methyltransferase n=1 Tax=unclassified Marinovum TaxID=2647166 RepID=UPI0026E1CF57|nr:MULTISPECIES: methyltransferase domain-containing protein [unclassified Marinovum]MDO6729466.1 methyltransferase domain-containing protein [Marinovum sp. 2_MG-2023]MDO6780381.1 methyltransferase domain-containing protein [Marinovum sp. 1_MG-2023]
MASLNRVFMQKKSRMLIRTLEPEKLEAVEISGVWGKNFGFRKYQSLYYPTHDICAGPLSDDAGVISCDIVLANQVWEHLDRPYGAIGHVREMLRPGGYFWVAVPFFVPYHGAPVDCSRWSARGLKNLLIEAGFPEENVVSDQWGNRAAGMRNLVGKWPPVYEKDHDDLENDDLFPVCAWALAQKETD